MLTGKNGFRSALLFSILIAIPAGGYALPTPVINKSISNADELNAIVVRVKKETAKVRVNNGIVYVDDEETARKTRMILMVENLVPKDVEPWEFFNHHESWTADSLKSNENIHELLSADIENHIMTLDEVDYAAVGLYIGIWTPECSYCDQKIPHGFLQLIVKRAKDITKKHHEGIIKLIEFASYNLIKYQEGKGEGTYLWFSAEDGGKELTAEEPEPVVPAAIRAARAEKLSTLPPRTPKKDTRDNAGTVYYQYDGTGLVYLSDGGVFYRCSGGKPAGYTKGGVIYSFEGAVLGFYKKPFIYDKNGNAQGASNPKKLGKNAAPKQFVYKAEKQELPAGLPVKQDAPFANKPKLKNDYSGGSLENVFSPSNEQLSGAKETEDTQGVYYQYNGIGYVYLSEDVFYLCYDGKPAAYIEGGVIYSFDGAVLGFYEEPFVFNKNGDAIGAADPQFLGRDAATKKRVNKSLKQKAPFKQAKGAFNKPYLQNRYIGGLLEDIF